MLDFSNTSINEVIAHTVGGSDDDLVLSASTINLNDSLLANLLNDYFLGSFKGAGFYSLHHDSELNLNEIYSYCKDYFQGEIDFIDFSRRVANHLKHVSTHPNIKSGELYIASFSDMVVDDELVDGIGIFKSESKERFLKVNRGASISVSCEFGASPRKLDKGCLVFNTEQELGFKLCVVDNTNRDEAKYWLNDFLRAKPRNDDFYQTKQAINLCHEFVQEVVKPENQFPMVEQADLLCKSRDFFKVNDVFKQDEFEEEVIQKPEMVEAFRDFKQKYEVEQGFNIPDGFKISTDATRQSQKFFKSIIKLDRNFHVYIHGSRERVERGFDADAGLNYYKLYFDQES